MQASDARAWSTVLPTLLPLGLGTFLRAFSELEAWAEELSQREHEAEKAGQAGDDPQEAAEGGRKAKRWWRRRKRN